MLFSVIFVCLKYFITTTVSVSFNTDFKMIYTDLKIEENIVKPRDK